MSKCRLVLWVQLVNTQPPVFRVCSVFFLFCFFWLASHKAVLVLRLIADVIAWLLRLLSTADQLSDYTVEVRMPQRTV